MRIVTYCKHFYLLVCTIGRRLFSDRLTYAAAALTYTTLLSIIPLMAVAFSILAIFPIFQAFHSSIQNFIFSNFVPASGKVVQSHIEDFLGQVTKLSFWNMLFLFVTAMLTMITIERALNDVWHIPARRRGLSAILRYWAILSLSPIALGISIMVTTYILSMRWLVGTVTYLGLNTLFLHALPFLVMWFILSFLYVAIPNCRVPWRCGILGGLFAALIFEVAKKGFLFYITRSHTYQVLYGALAVIPFFFIWIYLSWLIVLLGALVSNVTATEYYSRRGGVLDGFSHALLWIRELWYAQHDGNSLSIADLYRRCPAHYKVNPERQMRYLCENGIVQMTDDGSYVLVRDISEFTVAELHELLPWKLRSVSDSVHWNTKLEKFLNKANKALFDALDVPLLELFNE